ncbi:unnamed protein product [Heligmosomoides polygyrus]|uniref:Uncharacterized protein n=1 Tax=Heligmosomoides polygyrus TaxID=6339 RepID=A0A3P8AKJ9_HELPZ|nr:unnamed protein product [Heligmosomoides polygyrus]
MYYRYKPVDWILLDILQSRYCSLDKKADCPKGKRGNPPAIVVSSAATAKGYNAQDGYDKNNAIWMRDLGKGSSVSILFATVINLTGIMILSGVPPSPQDKLGPETVVHAYYESGAGTHLGNFSSSGDFLFRSCGMPVKSIRLEVAKDTTPHNVILDHIRIDTENGCGNGEVGLPEKSAPPYSPFRSGFS